MSEHTLFQVDSITIDGRAWSFVSGTARINGAVSHTKTPVPSGSGPDKQLHARVPRTIELELQFDRTVDPAELAKIDGARVVLKDSRSPRRCLAPNCSFGSLGPIGGGQAQFVLNALEEYQWL